MHKVLVLYPTPTDPQAFESYYRSTHLALAAKLPGVSEIRFSIGLENAPYFAVFEARFESAEAHAAAMRSPEGQAVAADIPNYATGGAVLMNFPVEEFPTQ